MSEHHGLDLEAIAAKSGGHSIFAPSSSAGWLTCADYILANINQPDNAGVDAAYGTVGHEVAEEWLKRIKRHLEKNPGKRFTEAVMDRCRPSHLVGTTRTVVEPSETFEILIDEEMLAFVQQYIAWCAELPGEHFIETRVDFSQLTPIPNQKGTADHAACEPGVLTVTDLKMGISPRNIVFAAEDDTDPRAIINGLFNGNPQAMIYALGFFFLYDHVYHFEKIVIRIAQPRLDHFHVWETTREELLAFAEFVKVRAAAAWAPQRDRRPSEKGCKWCKVRQSCPALIAWLHEDVADVFEAEGVSCEICDGFGCEVCRPQIDEDGVIEGSFRVVTAKEMQIVKAHIDATDDYHPPVLDLNPADLTTEQMAKLLPKRKLVESFFNALYDELLRRAALGEEVPGFKLVEGREGNREFKGGTDAEWFESEMDFVGLGADEIYEYVRISPNKATARLRAKYKISEKKAKELLEHLVFRNRGRQTLVLRTDKREEIEDPGTVFEAVAGYDEDEW